MLRWLPENISTFGQGVDNLFTLIYWITLVAFVLVMATLITFLIKYRHREGHRAEYIEGSTKLEIIWTAATTVIVFGLAMLSYPQWNKIKLPSEFPENPDVVVQVRGEQFNWYMIYPGPDDKLGTDDDLELENHLHVPANKIVHIHLTAKDVIHSFFVPQLRLKQDALPGRSINVWFDTDLEEEPIVNLENVKTKGCYTGTLTFADPNTPPVTGNIVLETDDTLTLKVADELKTYNKAEVKQLDVKVWRYEIPCAELCGFGHSGMIGYLNVHTQAGYDAWKAERWPQ
jgi:cytochrome c oxidase subunit 2